MADATVPIEPSTPVRGGTLSTGVAFYLQASIVVSFLAGSSAPTPLYAVYQAKWSFSPITTTVVFGVYAVAALASMLTVGSLSDHVGRRPVLLVAVSFQAAVMLVFATAGGVPMLVAARAVQGLATGAALGALGAAMVDLDKAKGTIANAVAPASGTAIGGLGSGLLVQYAPSPTHLVYLVLFAIFVAQVVGVVLMPESSAPTPGALASLRPTLALPAAVRRPIVAAAPALVAVWALAGFYGSLGPALTRLVTGSDSLALGGLSLFVLLGTAAVTVLSIRTTGPRSMMVLGVVALFVGVGTTLVAISQGSTAAFFAGTAVSGVGFGAGFQGALGTVLPCAAPHERAGVLSVLLMVSYFALGVPAVIAGILVVEVGGVLTTAREYGVAVMVLAALALVALTRAHSGPQLAPPNTLSAVDGDLLARAGCRP